MAAVDVATLSAKLTLDEREYIAGLETAMKTNDKFAASVAQFSASIENGFKKGGASAKILGDAVKEGAERGSGALAVLEKAARPMDALLGQLSGGGIQLGRVFGALTSPIGLTATALAAIGVTALHLVHQFAETGDQLIRLAAIAGSSASAVAQVETAFKLAGLGTEGFRTGLFRLSAQVDEGGSVFDKYGISVRTATGDLKTPLAVFEEWRNKMSTVTDAAALNAEAMHVLGRAGVGLVPVLRKNTEEWEALKAAARDTWTPAQTKAAEEYAAAVAKISVAAEKLRNELATPMVVWITFAVGNKTAALADVERWLLDTFTGANLLRGLGLVGPEDNLIGDLIFGNPATLARQKEMAEAVASDFAESQKGAVIQTQKEIQATLTEIADQAMKQRIDLTASEVQIQKTRYQSELDAAKQSYAQQNAAMANAVAAGTATQTAAAALRLRLLRQEAADVAATQDRLVDIALNSGSKDAKAYEAAKATRLAANAAAVTAIKTAEAGLTTAVQEQVQRRFQVELDAIKHAEQVDAASARLRATTRQVTEEQSAVEVGAIQIKSLQDQKIRVDAEVARFAASTTKGDELRKQSAVLAAQIAAAQVDQQGREWKRDTANVVAELALQQTAREGARDRAIAVVESQTAAALALIDMEGPATEQSAERVYAIAVNAAQRVGDLRDRELKEKLAALDQMGLSERELTQKREELNQQILTNEQTTDAAILAAVIARLKTITTVTRDEAGRIKDIQNRAEQEQLDALKNTTTGEIAEIEGRIDVINDALAAGVDSEVQRQELLTNLYILEGQKRVVAAESDASKRLNAVVTEMEGYERLRQRDVDNEVKIRAAMILGAKTAAETRVEIEAGVVSKVLAERQKYIDQINVINTQEEAFFKQGLERWAAQSRAVGDFTGFFSAQFASALTAGTGFYDSLTKGAQDAARAVQTAFSDFFFAVFTGKLDTLKDVFASFVSSLKRTAADFFSNLISNELGQLIGFGQGGANQLSQAASGTAVVLANQLAPAAQIAAQALLSIANGGGGLTSEGFTVNGSAIPSSTGVGAIGAVGGGLVNTLGTLNSVGSKLVSSWTALSAAFSEGFSTFQTSMALGTSTWTALTDGVKSGLDSLSGSMGQVSQAMKVAGAVAATVGVVLTALRTDITDTGKAVQAALITSAYAATFIPVYGWIVAAALVAISFILDWTGVFSKASAAWLSFGTRLGETLTKEGQAVQAFGKELGKVKDLSGIVTSIDKFKASIDAIIPDFSKRPEVAGLGPFQIPNIPGATGTEHEGGITMDFAPFFRDMQAAIDTALAAVRNTISVKFVDAAQKAMPADLFAAFRTGTIDVLRKSFDDLVASADATIDDVKEFEARMKEVGGLIVAFATVSVGLSELGKSAKKALPSDLFDPLVKMGVSLNQQLIDLAASGVATADDLKNVQAELDALAQIVLAFAQENQQLRELASVASVVLPAAVNVAVQALASGMRQALVDLAESGTATAADLQALEEQIVALGTTVALYASLTQEIAALSGDLVTTTLGAVDAARVAVESANRAILDARDAFAKAVTGPEMASAADVLHKAIIAKYDLERKLIADVSKAISDLLSKFGTSLISTAMVAVNFGLDRGSVSALTGLVAGLDAVQASAFTATVRIWAATQALAALAAAVPGIVSGFGPTGSNQINAGNINDMVLGLYRAALPSLTTIYNEFSRTLAAGDIQGALDLLGQGATAIAALANAAVTGVKQWEQEAVAATQTAAQALIDAETRKTQDRIDGINARAEADAKVNDLAIERLNTEKDALQESIRLWADWDRAAKSLQDYIRGIELSTKAPPNPVGQMNLARGFYDQAVAAYAANKTPDNLTAVQKAAEQYLTALQGVYTRPDPRYAAIFNAIDAQLRAFQADAASRVTPAEAAARSLKTIDDRIKELNDSTKTIRETAAAAVKEAERQRDLNIQTIERARDKEIDAIHAAARHTIDGIKDGVAAVMGAIATEEQRLLGLLIAQQETIMKSITGGMPVLEWQLREQLAERVALENLRDIVYAALTGAQIPKIPIPPGTETPGRRLPSAADGARVMMDGIVRVHAPEWIGEPAVLAPLPMPVLAGGGEGETDAGTWRGRAPVVVNIYGADQKKASEILDEMEARVDRAQRIGNQSGLRRGRR